VEGQAAALPLHLVTFILNKFESAPAQYGEERIEQIVSVELKAFAGHEAEEPVHFAVMSQGPVESLHTVKVELNAFVGQAPPLHTSVISHGPAEALQV